jgi:hypothetical protein
MPRTRYDVFLSYRRADTALVLPLRDEFRRLGYTVFFDTQSIEGGEDWKHRLERSIAESRALVLCWTESASKSEVVTFEYSCARALHKPVFPWLLDGTHLPVMLDNINGIPNPDAAQVAQAIKPRLGWTLASRRKLQTAFAALVTAAAVVTLWLAFKPAPPPPPWDFNGEVIDPTTRLGIPDVEVDITPDQGKLVASHTGADGRFDVTLPAPQTKYIKLEFKKAGYVGDEAIVPSGKPFRTDLTKLP